MKIYRVGGSVRDELLYGKIKGDRDYVVVGATEEEFLDRYPTAQKVGKAFPVFLVDGDEYAFARTERKVSAGYHGFETIFDPTITLEEDLKRRDLTINAIAKDCETGELTDPFNGQADLQAKKIIHVSDAFSEDPLRAYRVARFAATLPGFTVDIATIELMKTLLDELHTLSPERVWSECNRSLAQEAPDRFFIVLQKSNLLSAHFPELQKLIGVPAGPAEFHPEEDSFTHSIETMMRVTSSDPIIRFAALMHDIGKGETPQNEWPSHHNHTKTGLKLLKTFAKRLKVQSKHQKAANLAIKYHMKAGIIDEMTPKKIVDLLVAVRSFPVDGVRGFF
ncbi:HD domain-containing protein, partial [bacterium]|nr:HD domain-containing protein [bacterium]